MTCACGNEAAGIEEYCHACGIAPVCFDCLDDEWCPDCRKPTHPKIELLNCPFCKEPAEITKGIEGDDGLDEIWTVGCSACPAEMRGTRYDGDNDLFTDELNDLIISWNKR